MSYPHQLPLFSLPPPSFPLVPISPRPFSLPSEKKVYVYRGEGNNGEIKVFSSFENLRIFLLDRHGRIYQGKNILSETEFLRQSEGWGFELEVVDFY